MSAAVPEETYRIGATELEIREADITELEAEGIVNSANTSHSQRFSRDV